MTTFETITATETDPRLMYKALWAAGYVPRLADCEEMAYDNANAADLEAGGYGICPVCLDPVDYCLGGHDDEMMHD